MCSCIECPFTAEGIRMSCMICPYADGTEGEE